MYTRNVYYIPRTYFGMYSVTFLLTLCTLPLDSKPQRDLGHRQLGDGAPIRIHEGLVKPHLMEPPKRSEMPLPHHDTSNRYRHTPGQVNPEYVRWYYSISFKNSNRANVRLADWIKKKLSGIHLPWCMALSFAGLGTIKPGEKLGPSSAPPAPLNP